MYNRIDQIRLPYHIRATSSMVAERLHWTKFADDEIQCRHKALHCKENGNSAVHSPTTDRYHNRYRSCFSQPPKMALYQGIRAFCMHERVWLKLQRNMHLEIKSGEISTFVFGYGIFFWVRLRSRFDTSPEDHIWAKFCAGFWVFFYSKWRFKKCVWVRRKILINKGF